MNSSLNGLRRFCIQPRYIHIYNKPLTRRFATKSTKINGNNDGLPGKAKPNYILRILFVNSIIGGGIAYYYGWTDDIIQFAQQRFSYLETFTKDKKDKKTSGSVYKLPKPKRDQSSTRKSPKSSKSEPKSISKSIPKPKPKSKPESKPKSKPISKIESLSDAPKSDPPKEIKSESIQPSITLPVQETIEVLKKEKQEISKELLAKYEKLKREVIALASDDNKDGNNNDNNDKNQIESKLKDDSDLTEIVELKRRLNQV